MAMVLAIAKYRFRMVAVSEIALPEYKGSAFHGGFGHALRKIAPSWYRHLFEPGPPGGNLSSKPTLSASTAWPKPFVLLPPLDELRRYPPGHPFECELTLFGSAIQHYPICHAALEYLGSSMGLGTNRGNFRVEGVDIARAGSTNSVPNPTNHAISSSAIMAARQGLDTDRVTLNYLTRLRLKAGNRLHREAPPFSIFLARLMGRLNTLSTLYGSGELLDRQRCNELQQQAEQITIAPNNARWNDWNRYSGRQNEWMKFGGLVGSASYAGDMRPFLPWLALGEWVHVGGKTSFGLGKYEMV